MKVFHATPTRNIESIFKHGLSADFAVGHNRHTWMCVESNIEWAILHTLKHDASVEEISVIELSVPRSWLKNHKLVIRGKARRGFWKTGMTVLPERIKAIRPAADYGKRSI